MSIGPVQLVVLGFDELNFHGEIIAVRWCRQPPAGNERGSATTSASVVPQR